MDEDSESSNEETFFIPGYKNANAYFQDALRSILMATKASNELPSAGNDFDYYSTFPGFRAVMLHKGQSILSLMTSLIQRQGIREKFQGRELEEKFDLLSNVNDAILENISNCLDEASGLKKSEEELVLAVKPPSAINTSWNKKQFNTSSENFKLLIAKNVSRPQLSFKDKIDNSNSLFVPIIKEKPNSIKPLAIILEKDKDSEEFCHPYEIEIEKFSASDDILQLIDPIVPKPLEETPLIFVKTEQQLKDLCDELKKEKAFAVDLEHHNYRSFQGFTCLMQISTREKDYLIDVLDLRSELHILNDVFTDPKIVKVFHGADMDILWLQKDFGIYVVNLFDTGQAARVLHFAHLSLSYLLKHYCKLDVDKQFQLADWRIRPLPSGMIRYARQDTHYLLYIYDCLRNDLINNGNETKNLLRSTFERGKMICLKRYQKPLFNEDKYLELCKKHNKLLNAKQLYCLKELYAWRDRIARENDESLAYVLPNHMLLQIAEAVPREQQGILACCNPIPPLVKQQLNEIHSIMVKANESTLKELTALELQQKAQTNSVNHCIDLNNILHCPHDILHVEEKRAHTSQSFNAEISLPLITKEDTPVPQLRKDPTLKALFESTSNKTNTSNKQKKTPPSKISEALSKLLSPFRRYVVTEQLQVNQKKDSTPISATIIVEENCSVGEPSQSDSSIVNSAPSTSEEQNVSAVNSSLNTSSEMTTSTPFRSKKKRNKNKRKPEPDISLINTPDHNAPPSKKSKTPEVVTIDESFQPYDYSKTDMNDFSGKKKSRDKFNPQTEHNFKGPGRHHGRDKKHFKQATFGEQSAQSKKKWPKNK